MEIKVFKPSSMRGSGEASHIPSRRSSSRIVRTKNTETSAKRKLFLLQSSEDDPEIEKTFFEAKSLSKGKNIAASNSTGITFFI